MRWAQPGAAAAAAALALAAFAGGGSGGPGLVRGPAEASAPNVSSNWAGYVATGTGSTTVTASPDMAFTDVTGRWRQPAATCTPGSTSSAAVWVGLGGYSESSEKLEQAGTSADCDPAGRPRYYAWYELVPADSVNISLPIRPGDVITASVVVEGDDVLVQIKNRTRRRSFTKHLPMTAPDMTSAEWIAEAPAACGALGCRDLEADELRLGRLLAHLREGQRGRRHDLEPELARDRDPPRAAGEALLRRQRGARRHWAGGRTERPCTRRQRLHRQLASPPRGPRVLSHPAGSRGLRGPTVRPTQPREPAQAVW